MWTYMEGGLNGHKCWKVCQIKPKHRGNWSKNDISTMLWHWMLKMTCQLIC